MKACDPLVLKRMDGLLSMYGTWSAVAATFGVTPAYISNIRSGFSAPSEAILKEIGLRREVVRTVRYFTLDGDA
jgi:transcriptional regulator with XRE-family HTH domain